MHIVFAKKKKIVSVIFAAMKVLMVCLGNICRSPLAQGILQKKAIQHKLNWQVDSAGTSNYHCGEAPHELSQKVALQYGIDITQQICRQFVKTDILHFDKIYVMDKNNYTEVKRIAGILWDATKIDLLLNECYPEANREVPDPWGGSEKGFDDVYQMIEQACNKIIHKYAIY